MSNWLEEFIAKEATQEREAILEKSQKEASQIRARAEEEAERAKAKHLPLFQARAELAKNRILHQAEFDVQVKVTAEKKKIVDQFLSQVSGQLEDLRGTDAYRSLLKGLLEEVFALTNQPAKIFVASEDVALAKSLLQELGKTEVEVLEASMKWGGIRLETLDGMVALDNTLESRFYKAQEVYKEDVAKDLFG